MDDAHNEADEVAAEALGLLRGEVGPLEPLLVPLMRPKPNLSKGADLYIEFKGKKVLWIEIQIQNDLEVLAGNGSKRSTFQIRFGIGNRSKLTDIFLLKNHENPTQIQR